MITLRRTNWGALYTGGLRGFFLCFLVLDMRFPSRRSVLSENETNDAVGDGDRKVSNKTRKNIQKYQNTKHSTVVVVGAMTTTENRESVWYLLL